MTASQADQVIALLWVIVVLLALIFTVIAIIGNGVARILNRRQP